MRCCTSIASARLHIPFDLPAPVVGLLLVVLLPLALAVPAIQMFIAMFCRSYKEGQTYLSLLLFVPMIPGFLFAFDAVASAPWMTWTPLLSQQLAVAALIKGEAIAVSSVLAAGLMTLAHRIGRAVAMRTYAWRRTPRLRGLGSRVTRSRSGPRDDADHRRGQPDTGPRASRAWVGAAPGGARL